MSISIDRFAIGRACAPRRIAVILALTLFATVAGSVGPVAPAAAQAAALTREQAEAQAAYDKALREFKAVLAERRGQIEAKKPLPERPGQALYLARLQVISTYKDLTDAVPARIGRPNRFSVPPAYFDADIEPLVEEYAALFAIMQAPPAGAQASATPFKDVADLGRAIARARGLDAATVDAAGRISLGIFFAETGGNQNIGNARSNTYKGSFQTGVAEDRKGRAAWAALRPRIAALDPGLAARDETETARVGTGDQRFNHWTAVRNGLMNAHYDLFAQIPQIAALLPDQIDQMKLFQLIQIVPSPTRAALKSGNFAAYRISDPRIMGYLRNNSIFTFGKADRARASATMREILDAMWLFTPKFERARTLYEEIKHGRAG
jgi:type II secretory pathway pseudopilin PulG